MIRFKAALFGVVIGGASLNAAADPLAMRFYDGDTVAPTVRLTIDGQTSFDTPETSYRWDAKCDLEIERGKAAKARLREIKKAAQRVDFIPVLDPDGTVARTGGDRPRLLMRMLTDGVNVGKILAAEGLAMVYDWRTERVDWCSAKPRIIPR